MQDFNQVIIPDPSEPFKECKLKRQPFANALTNVIVNHPSGFVMSINGDWGVGKTTFLRMWKADLTNNHGFETLYINAWESDYIADPMALIMSCLKELNDTDGKRQEKFDTMLEYGGRIVTSVIPKLLKGYFKQKFGSDEIGEAIEELANLGSDELITQISEATTAKQNLDKFRVSIESYLKAKKGVDEKPVVLFVDELDRCRPSFAVECLEQIKHFFAVKGIVFVLGINKVEMGNSVKGFYGSDAIDGVSYLTRFIDYGVELPNPSISQYVMSLYLRFELNLKCKEANEEQLKEYMEFLFEKTKLPLRDIKRTINKFQITVTSLQSIQHDDYCPLLFLVYIEMHQNAQFKQIMSDQLTVNQLLGLVVNYKPPQEPEFNSLYESYCELSAKIIWLYAKRMGVKREEIVSVKHVGGIPKPVAITLSNLKDDVLMHYLFNYSYSYRGNVKHLRTYLSSINLDIS